MATQKNLSLEYGAINTRFKLEVVALMIIPALLAIAAWFWGPFWSFLYIIVIAIAVWIVSQRANKLVASQYKGEGSKPKDNNLWFTIIVLAGIVVVGIMSIIVGQIFSPIISTSLQLLAAWPWWLIPVITLILITYHLLCTIGYRDTGMVRMYIVVFAVAIALFAGFNQKHLPVTSEPNQQQLKAFCEQDKAELYPAQCV